MSPVHPEKRDEPRDVTELGIVTLERDVLFLNAEDAMLLTVYVYVRCRVCHSPSSSCSRYSSVRLTVDGTVKTVDEPEYPVMVAVEPE